MLYSCPGGPNTFWTNVLIIVGILLVIMFILACQGGKK